MVLLVSNPQPPPNFKHCNHASKRCEAPHLQTHPSLTFTKPHHSDFSHSQRNDDLPLPLLSGRRFFFRPSNHVARQPNRSIPNHRLHRHVPNLPLLLPGSQSPRYEPLRPALQRLVATVLRLVWSWDHDFYGYLLRIYYVPSWMVGHRDVF